MKYLLTVTYRGDGFCGFQFQPDRRTVQGTLTQAFSSLFEGPVAVTGCSRTDSGVHANEFCAAVSRKGEAGLQTGIPIGRLPLAFSAHLPPDISVFDAVWVNEDFHPRYDVCEKEYLYRIYNRPVRSPFEEGRSCHIPRPITYRDLARMQEAAAYFVGTHDFSAYNPCWFLASNPESRIPLYEI